MADYTNNNIYGNAAFVGCLAGMLAGRRITSAVAADYDDLVDSARAMADDIDALIAFDALVTTDMAVTQLAITTNTIAADEQWRAGLLQAICQATMSSRFTESAAIAGAQTVAVAAAHACWTSALAQLETP